MKSILRTVVLLGALAGLAAGVYVYLRPPPTGAQEDMSGNMASSRPERPVAGTTSATAAKAGVGSSGTTRPTPPDSRRGSAVGATSGTGSGVTSRGDATAGAPPAGGAGVFGVPLAGGRESIEERAFRLRTQSRREALEPFFDKIGLTEDERRKTMRILYDSTQAVGELARKNQAEGGDAKDLATRAKDERAQRDAQLVALLGPERTAELKNYENAAPFQPVVKDTAARCAAAGLPLSDETARALASMLYQKMIFPPSSTAVSAQEYTVRTARDPLAIAAAEKLLTPQQLAIFKESLAARHPIAR